MLDTIGTIACTVVYVAQVGVLAGFAAATRAARRAAIVAALLWAGVMVLIGALGGFSQEATGAAAVPLLAFAALIVLLLGSWLLSSRFRDALLAVPLPALSSPGVLFRVFMGGEGTLAMAGLPWVMVPALLVPVYLLVHCVIAAKVKAIQPSTEAISMAHAH